MTRTTGEPSGRWILAAVVLGSGIVFLDGTIVNVALPKMGEELPSTVLGVLEGQAYVVSGYLATLAALLIISGALADKYGRKRIFTIGLALFGTFSTLCGLAPTMEFEVVFRICQGAAGALLVPGSLAIITASFEGQARARAFGIWAAATSALTILGPLVGGIIVQVFSWRLAFLLNVPLVILALYAAVRHVPESRNEDAPAHLDWLGSIVIAVAVGGISFGLIRGQENEWSDATAYVALAVGIVAAVAFPILMVRRKDPLVPPALFRRREFVVINLSTFLIYGALYVTGIFQSLFLQGVLGYTAIAAAAIGLPTGILLSLGSTRVGTLAGRIGPRTFLVVGPTFMGLGALWWTRVPSTSQPWTPSPATAGSLIPPFDTLVDVMPAVLLYGVGITLVVAPLTTALMDSVPVRNAGLGSAINNAVSRVGQPLLTAVLFIAITTTFYASIAQSFPDLDTSSAAVRKQIQPMNPPGPLVPAAQDATVDAASTQSFHLAMLVNAALLFGGAVVNGVGLRRRPAPGSDAATAPEAGSGSGASIGTPAG